MSLLSNEFGLIQATADVTISSPVATEDNAISSADVSKGKKEWVKLDPDAGANVAFKARVGKGFYAVMAAGRLTATSAVCGARLYRTPKNGSEAEDTSAAIDTPSGGGPFTMLEVIEVTAPYEDIELKVSNETNTNNLTVAKGTKLLVLGVSTEAPRQAK